MDISDKFDDPVLVDLLASVDGIASRMRIPFFVVGAMARNLVLHYGFGIRVGRATKDMDLGVRVASKEEYEKLKAALISGGKFTAVGNSQRMSFVGRVDVDFLPFGDILDVRKRIFWGAGNETEFNLAGFDEAYQHAIRVKVSSEPKVEVMVASATGLVLLKILAWDDRRPLTKDAIDLGVLIRTYVEAGNLARLYEEHPDLLEKEEFDYQWAGAHMLGRDLAQICEAPTRQRILDILDRELAADGDLPLVVASASSSPQISRTLEFWRAIRNELSAAQDFTSRD